MLPPAAVGDLRTCACGCQQTFLTTQNHKYIRGHGDPANRHYKPKSHTAVLCACGCGESFQPNGYPTKYKKNHSPHRWHKRRRQTTEVLAYAPEPERPSACEKCGNGVMTMDEAYNIQDLGAIVEYYWHCLICGFIKFQRPGVKEVAEETVNADQGGTG